MSDQRTKSTQDKVNTVNDTAEAIAKTNERITAKEVATAIANQVKLVHPAKETK